MDIIPEKIMLYSWEGRVWDVDIERVRTGGFVFGGHSVPRTLFVLSPPPADPSPPASALPQDSVDMSISSPFMIVDGNGEPSVVQSPTGSLGAGDNDIGAYSLSEQLSFRLASDEKKFRVLKRPRSGSIAGFNSLQIPTVFVRRNINYLQQPSHCVLKIPFVGEIVSGLTWGKRGYPDEVCINELWPHLQKLFRFVKGVYMEFLIVEPSSDDGGIVLQVMVFNSNGTLCQPNVHVV
ncbi:hypothetical protein ACFE04_001012 [Oxalis oulophora]